VARLQTLATKAWTAVVALVTVMSNLIRAAATPWFWVNDPKRGRVLDEVIRWSTLAVLLAFVGVAGWLIHDIRSGNNPLDRLPWRQLQATLYDDFENGSLDDRWIPQDQWGFITEQGGFLHLLAATPVPEFRESIIAVPEDRGRIREIEFSIAFVSGSVPTDGDEEDPWAGGGLVLVLESGEMLSVETEVNLEYGPRLFVTWCENEHADPIEDHCDEISELDSDVGTRHDVRVVWTGAEVRFFAGEHEFGRYFTKSPIVAWQFLVYADAGTTVHSAVDDVSVKY
jgi:hypothetical protein